jgi:pterin-4a-carbinolamine dehydratase
LRKDLHATPGGVPPLTGEVAARYHEQVPNWTLLNDSRQIERSFWFANFREASCNA